MNFDERYAEAPAIMLQRMRYAASERGEAPLEGYAARKILKDFSVSMSQQPGKKKPQPYYQRQNIAQMGGYTGSGEDYRDPQPLSYAIDKLIRSRGWKDPVAVSSVLARWKELMGEHVAEHTTPEKYQDTKVTIRCSSTSWATNLKLMKSEVLKMFERELGAGIVTDIIILGPHTRQWKHGKLVAPGGRGPRDTYG
ncbi:DUF721 domain-containing protein [Rothia sp. P6271]|uniref:DUF721 domain-containing protein n=1 Tax=Rothia sp. P6271 TaxID=3402659 RepID=UPI003AC49960